MEERKKGIFLMINDILRFTTAGSVDDGKSTLIGRLLFDSKNIPLDLLESIEKVSNKKRGDYLDLSLLTDGLNLKENKESQYCCIQIFFYQKAKVYNC